MFQCSSASRKFLNPVLRPAHRGATCAVSVLFSEPKIPQCYDARGMTHDPATCFSALQRAENSSIQQQIDGRNPQQRVSVLFSEPKIPQSNDASSVTTCVLVSVLFSEPKIPQSARSAASRSPRTGFSALQRAENSSIPTLAPASIHISDRDDHASSFLSLPGASP